MSVLYIKYVHETRDVSSSNWNFHRFSWNPKVKSIHDLKATHNTFRVYRLHLRHTFFRQPLLKGLYLSFVFLRGHDNESWNLIGSLCGSDSPISAYGPTTSLASWLRLVTCGKGKFRWLDYPNRSALYKSCEICSEWVASNRIPLLCSKGSGIDTVPITQIAT